ncbi:MAG: hypothetical protein ACLR5O_00760 [Romboutsia timonensis]|uniref:hypothetical protein n=1 Tax=Romboutsia timonensis TaxID=1776391 RepID=UPI0039A23AE1
MMHRIYNQKEMRAMDIATKLLEENRITLGEYHKFIELVNNGTYMKLIGSIESMKDGFVFSGIKMSDEKKSYTKAIKDESDKGFENFLDKEDEERILSDFEDYLSKLSETHNLHKLNTMRNPFMDALIDGLERVAKQKQTPTVDLSESRLDLPLCPRRNNGDFNYDYSKWLNNRKEICTKCNTLCPERETYIKDDEALYNYAPSSYVPESVLDSDFDSLPIEDDYTIEPEDCLYSYADVMRMLLNMSDIQIPRQTLMTMDDLELENYAHQISKNNDSFKFKYDKIREIMNDVAQKRS